MRARSLAIQVFLVAAFAPENGCWHAPGEAVEPAAAVARIEPLTKSWQKPIPFQATPAGLDSIRAAECAGCHEDAAREWAISAHGLAWSDSQFQAEWRKDGELWICLGCHTPLENQLSRVVVGVLGGDLQRPASKPNRAYDEKLRDEGITCAACHVRDGQVLAPDGAGGAAPHAILAAPERLGTDLCLGCHNVSDVVSPALVCSFTTGDEWRRSPAAAQSKDCVSCHMPPIERPIARGGPARQAHSHVFAGMGLAKVEDAVEAQATAYRPGIEVEARFDRQTAVPGEVGRVEIVVTNRHAGHDVPTGDVERFVTVTVTVTDAAGKILAEESERIGEVWQWWPAAKKLADSSLGPGESRSFLLPVPAPADGAGGPARVEIVVENHRATQENARAMHLPGGYPISRVVRRIVLPIGEAGGRAP